MTNPRQRATRYLVAGSAFTLLGLLAWALYFLQSASESHSYTGGTPPTYVQLKPGHTYWLAISGGVRKEISLGLNPGNLQCTATVPGRAPGPLAVTAEPRDTKETDRIGSFTASIDGAAQVQCGGLGTVFVENSADAPFDLSGLELVLATLLLAVGIPLTLSGFRSLNLLARERAQRPVPAQSEPELNPWFGGKPPVATK